jgi:protein gp37
MNETIISWTNLTWNVWSGCKKISPGCGHCYAHTIAENKRGTRAFPNGFDLTYRWHKLNDPLKIKEPSRIFVNSMSDLFLEDVPDENILKVFDVMNRAHWHTFQILTKRSERLSQLRKSWPWSPNIWMGVSIESPKFLYRLDHLREVPALTRFVSFEPLLELIESPDLSGIHWAIVGGESGPKFRPMEQSWARSIRDACVEQGVAYFYKQSAAFRTETRPWLEEEDGSRWKWAQYPGDLAQPIQVF